MVRTFFSDRNFVSGSRLKEKNRETANWTPRKDIYFLKLIHRLSGKHCLCPLPGLSLPLQYKPLNIIGTSDLDAPSTKCSDSKFLLLSFRIPSIFTRFLSRAEPPGETCWSWLSNKYLQIVHKGEYQKGRNFSFLTASQPATWLVGQLVIGSHLIK